VFAEAFVVVTGRIADPEPSLVRRLKVCGAGDPEGAWVIPWPSPFVGDRGEVGCPCAVSAQKGI
jgi:hypothetical protein